VLAVLCGAAQAQNRPGDFDFYVLSLSWSPSYCAAEGVRADDAQCSGERPYEFVVHGLWPQYERGYPEFCNARAPRIPQKLIDSMLDLMPSKNLVINQWRKHGTCAASDAAAYFASIRDARDRIAIPDSYVNVHDWRLVSPGEVENAFIAANPNMAADGIAVTCDSRHLREVRICVSRDLEFRSCPEIDRRACRVKKVAMPPSR
jgi:ribonuclease T2